MEGRLLTGLGILGWAALEPVVLAALVTETPLLLVGPHGCAKSLLLTRLADAMGLTLRHYNASTLNFDDLVGFPVPDGDTVRYLRTPLDAWDADAVFIDELSRCRADLQNRLFPLIHERRLQGRRLERLRFRWSAMNPPPDPNTHPDEALYGGAVALDTALADRFPWVVEVPTELSEPERFELLEGPEPTPEGASALREAVSAARALRGLVLEIHGAGVARYVNTAAHALERAGVPVSLRRLRMLRDNVLAVLATREWDHPADAALLALRWSLPDRARGPFDAGKVLEAHLVARDFLKAPTDPHRIKLLAERDPVRRITIALETDDDVLTATVLDALAGLKEPFRLALAKSLFPLLARTRPQLPGIVFEALAADLVRLDTLRRKVVKVQSSGGNRRDANTIGRVISELPRDLAWLADVLWLTFRSPQTAYPSEVVAFARTTQDLLHGTSADGAAA